jgi:perosamine synthetase
MIKSLICDCNSTLLEAMHIINENSMNVCFVVDDSNVLKGVVTDGDIRRAILDHISLDSLIVEILNENFVFGYQDDSSVTLINKFNKGITVIPIVDKNNHLVDYFKHSYQSHFPVAIPNLGGNEFKYLADAFLSTWISSTGSYINKFENEFSKYSDCSYGSAVSNGTVALHLALVVLDIGVGDEVIVPNLTFAATINAVLHANATPVIVDVEENSWCIDPKEIEKSITPRTKAIIPVHLYGQPCDMGAIMKIAKQYKLKVIEDCAEAHGAMFNNQKVGSFGDIGCFSFFGNKVITTGEGGMCTTNDPLLNKKINILRGHGMSAEKRYWHDVVGFNYRMTNLQAAIGVAQLERIEDIHKNRKEYEDFYRETLSEKNYTFQSDLKGRRRITWLVSFLVDKNTNREEYIGNLKEKGIDARPFFYLLSDMDIYKKYCHKSTPVSKKISTLGLSLPTYESLKSIVEIKNILTGVKREGIV